MNNLRREEAGQIAIMMVLTIPVMFMFMALALDAGVWAVDHRMAQNQVDAAALAAAQSLPVQDTARVGTWLAKNGSGPEDLCVPDGNGPYPQYLDRYPSGGDGRIDTVRVCVRRKSHGIFSNLSGISFVWISAAAGATASWEPALYSMFANHSCPDSDLQELCSQVGG